jgi:hypothetical protein
MRKSQITFFIVLGVIIVFAAYFMFYFSSSTKEDVAETGTEAATKELLRSSSVKTFVTSCLSSALDDGLEIIGRQSGYITKDCKGNVFSSSFPDALYRLTIQPQNLSYGSKNSSCSLSNNYTVIYLIRSNTYYPPAEAYPSVNFTENGSAANFGRSALPDLRSTPFSIESQLDSYIASRAKDCLNFSGFQQGITAGNVTIGTSINEVDVTAAMNVSIVIEGKPFTELSNFKASKKIRLKNIYDFVNEMISKDNSFLAFNLKDDYRKLSTWKSGFEVDVIEVSNQTDIIVVNDSLSSLFGENYLFVFARQNRPPVISFIKDIPNVQPTPVHYTALDPDEDNLTVKIVWDLPRWPEGPNSPNPYNCPGLSCYANITVTDPAGLYDFQGFRVYVPS